MLKFLGVWIIVVAQAWQFKTFLVKKVNSIKMLVLTLCWVIKKIYFYLVFCSYQKVMLSRHSEEVFKES